MFICQVIVSRGNGGLEKHVRELSQCLVKQGHRVLVIGDPVFVSTLPSGVESETINTRMSRYHPWLYYQLLKKLRQYPFDVIHAQANKAAAIVARLKPLLIPPIVATIHNIKSHLGIYQQFPRVICVSQYLAKQLNQTSTTVIYNGIQQPQKSRIDARKTYQLPKDKPVICAVGRLVYAKGFDVLLEAVDGLPLSLIIAGSGPEYQQLAQRVQSMHADTVVRLIGHHDVPSDIMQDVDALVISSRREGFSYVLNEALLSQVSILSTDVPVANEVLPEALIVPSDDANALRARLSTLLNLKQGWTEQMRVAFAYAQQKMTLTRMTEETVCVYQQLVNKAK